MDTTVNGVKYLYVSDKSDITINRKDKSVIIPSMYWKIVGNDTLIEASILTFIVTPDADSLFNKVFSSIVLNKVDKYLKQDAKKIIRKKNK
jgi:hypothetical protein